MPGKFKKDDHVKVLTDKPLARRKGQTGTVVSFYKDLQYRYKVKFSDGRVWYYNPRELELIPEEISNGKEA